MALQTKSFSWGSYAWHSESNSYVLTLTLTENSTSVETNTSSISYELVLTSGSQNRFQCDITSTLILNNERTITNTENKYLDYNSSWTLLSGTTTVTHGPDGSLNMPIVVSIDTTNSNTWAPPDKTLNWSWTLTDIPRGSSFGAITGNTIGSNMTVNITSNSSSFTHKLWYKLGDSIWYLVNDVIDKGVIYDCATFEISNELLSRLPNDPSGTLELCLRTLNGTTQIGSDVYKDVTVYVENTVKPTLGTLELDPNIITTTFNGVSTKHNILVQGKNRINFGYSGCSAGFGSSIASYKFEVLYEGSVIQTETTTRSDWYLIELGPFKQYGELKFRFTVTDTRGRSTSNAGSEPTYMCHQYFTPYISSFNAYRATDDGSPSLNGGFLGCTYNTNYADVDGTNDVIVTMYYNGTPTTNFDQDLPVDLEGDTATTYNVYLAIVDAYGGRYATEPVTVFGEARILNITSDGTGIAIGKMAEESETFECRWPAKFNSEVNCPTVNCDTVNCDGDIDCITVNCESVTIDNESIFNLIYPVGSIYMSVNSTSPSVLFGGTWDRLEGRFLLGAGTTVYTTESGETINGGTYNNGRIGGSENVALTVAEMPSHDHLMLPIIQNDYGDSWTTGTYTVVHPHNNLVAPNQTVTTSMPYGGASGYTGESQSHNNMPPYLAVYMWKRTA